MLARFMFLFVRLQILYFRFLFVFLRCGMLLLALAFLLWFNCCRSVLFVLLSYLIDLVVLLCNFEFVFSCFCLVALLAS